MLEGSKGDQPKSWHEELHHLTLPSPATLYPHFHTAAIKSLWEGHPLDIHTPHKATIYTIS